MIGQGNGLHLPSANTQINAENQLELGKHVLVLESRWPWIVWPQTNLQEVLSCRQVLCPGSMYWGWQNFFLNKLHGHSIVRNISFPIWIKTFTRVRGLGWGLPGYRQSALCRCQYLRTCLRAGKCRSLHDLLHSEKGVCFIRQHLLHGRVPGKNPFSISWSTENSIFSSFR